MILRSASRCVDMHVTYWTAVGAWPRGHRLDGYTVWDDEDRRVELWAKEILLPDWLERVGSS